jgi:hypothetical protein
VSRRVLRSLLAAGGALVVIWALGGPVGALLNAPGLLLLGGARRLGVSTGSEPSLGAWLWLGTGISVSFWGLAVYAALAALDRKAGAGA